MEVHCSFYNIRLIFSASRLCIGPSAALRRVGRSEYCQASCDTFVHCRTDLLRGHLGVDVRFGRVWRSDSAFESERRRAAEQRLPGRVRRDTAQTRIPTSDRVCASDWLFS